MSAGAIARHHDRLTPQRPAPPDPGNERPWDEVERDRLAMKGEGPERAPVESEPRPRPVWERHLELALAAGHVLPTKADGSKLFRESMSVRPWLLWEGFPGFERSKHVPNAAERAALSRPRWIFALAQPPPAGWRAGAYQRGIQSRGNGRRDR